MKKAIMLSLATVLAVTATVLVIPVPASAKCVKSCTALKNGCIRRGGNPAACSAGYAHCLKTGVYAGMPSGRTHYNLCRR